MSKFDELFDELMWKARSAADVASQKTNEVMEFSKLKYQLKQAQWDIEKAYSKLGAFVYESKKSGEDFADLINLATSEIDMLVEKVEELERQILACKKVLKCSSCGKENPRESLFCSRCGANLDHGVRPEPEEEPIVAEAVTVEEPTE